MATDPMLGGASIELDPLTTTNRDLSALASGGIRDRHKPETQVINKFAAPLNNGVAPQRQAPSVNRSMIIAGYKGKADAWIRCLKEVLHINGQQVDRKFYLSLDPREMGRQAELMEVGSQAFSTFVVLPYRDELPNNPVGMPAARNLHSFVGRITEEFRNVGPVLIVLPFHTLMPGGFDFIERNYSHAISAKGIAFLGYEVKKPEGRQPGSAIVLPPNWARHPDYPLAKGLSQYTVGDITYIKDEILRSMRASDVMIGHGMKPGATTAIQTFPGDEIIDAAKPAAFNPQGRPHSPSAPARRPEATLEERQAAVQPRVVEPTPEQIYPVQPVVNPTEPIVYPVAVSPFNSDEKAAALVLISQLGMAAVRTLDATRYGLTLADDAEFADATVSKAQGYKLRAGKAAKAK